MESMAERASKCCEVGDREAERGLKPSGRLTSPIPSSAAATWFLIIAFPTKL